MESIIPATLDALRVPTSSLKPYERNPRQGDVETIKASLERHGQYRPIVVNARTQEVLAGNHTLYAARELGWSEIAATFVDVDEDTAARIVLIDNRANDLAAYDDQALADLLRTLGDDLGGTGFSDDDLTALLKTLEPPDLDALADEHGDPTDQDTWMTIRVVVPPEVMAAWRRCVEEHDGNEVEAITALLAA